MDLVNKIIVSPFIQFFNAKRVAPMAPLSENNVSIFETQRDGKHRENVIKGEVNFEKPLVSGLILIFAHTLTFRCVRGKCQNVRPDTKGFHLYTYLILASKNPQIRVCASVFENTISEKNMLFGR
ncbi:MAG: hypothetical protein H0T62_05050 [Parachlamydiaceae bacterium]|nr:hypothetical protein [Parachlamydiaceae bacterium]